MPRRRSGTPRVRDMTMLSGWLFADLLLGLTIIFLVIAPAGSFAPLPPTPTFTPLPTYTPDATYTPNPTATYYPTFTPGPTATPYPTYTPGPSPTPYPTYTPGPTATPYPTYTPGPSPTPYPTYTPGPSPTPYPTYTPGPKPTVIKTNEVVLSKQAVSFTLVTDANALLGPDGAAKDQERARLRGEIRQQLASLQQKRAGIVLTFGTAPVPAQGGQLSQEVNALLQDAMPNVFGGAVMRSFHHIANNRGVVDIEVYTIVEGQ